MENMLKPFWKGNIVYNESILLVSEGGKQACGGLFFSPTEIISVKSSDLETEFIKGTDWEWSEGKIVRLEGSKMPYLNDFDLVFDEKGDKDCFDSKDGRYVFFSRRGHFHLHQIAVTYKHDDEWKPKSDISSPKQLRAIKEKLLGKEPITVGFFGDSITAGCDVSGMFDLKPNMDIWPRLVTGELERRFGVSIGYVNNAVGGKCSAWGAETAQERLADHKPDLAVIAFGMNDGTEKISAEDFIKNIKTIRDAVAEKNPAAEFIFVSTTLANPESVFDGLQREYYPVLKDIARENDVVADMTYIHGELLKRKRFQDMSGNNINHPNDFLARIYAQRILELFDMGESR